MKDSIVNELITAMKDRLPPGQNLANFLTDTLCIGREAVYRRLRGEVAFTIDEVAQISYKLGISIEKTKRTDIFRNAAWIQEPTW